MPLHSMPLPRMRKAAVGGPARAPGPTLSTRRRFGPGRSRGVKSIDPPRRELGHQRCEPPFPATVRRAMRMSIFSQIKAYASFTNPLGRRPSVIRRRFTLLRCARRLITKWGPALLPAPNAPSEGSVGVRELVGLRFPVLDPGSPAQASLPKHRSQSEDGFVALPRPFLGRSPFASPAHRSEPRVATERLALPAPLPVGPIRNRNSLSSPSGGDRSFRVLPPERGGTLPSRSPIAYAPRIRVAPSKFVSAWPVDSGDIGCNIAAASMRPLLPFRSRFPTSTPCPNPLPPTLCTSRASTRRSARRC